MIIKFSDNVFKQVSGIFSYNKKSVFFFLLIAAIAATQYQLAEIFTIEPLELPVVPVSILGGALAIFLGFRNNSAYDRWWEARKIWGGIVNASRTFGTYIISYSSDTFFNKDRKGEPAATWRKDLIYRHIAWLYSLNMSLRQKDCREQLEKYLSGREAKELENYRSAATQLLNKQGLKLQEGYERGIIEDFRHMELGAMIKEMYSLQGMAERIKNTIFPYYYNYFTKIFLWLFIICLPFALVQDMGWGAIPMTAGIAFVFNILEKSGTVTEDPFESRAADVPILTITRNIEIDLLEMLDDETIPRPVGPSVGRFDVRFIQ